jgi:hypothetical protein
MNLLEEIEAEARPSSPSCTTGKVLEAMSDEDRNAVLTAFRRGYRDTAIRAALAKRSVDVSVDSIRNHRRRVMNAPAGEKCKCPISPTT